MAVTLYVEPSFIALGPFHLIVGINTRVWFYAFTENGSNVLLALIQWTFC